MQLTLQTSATPAPPAVVWQFHDDWLLWNVYSDGSVREFNTELWPEHDHGENWPAVERVAASGRRDRASRLSRFRMDNAFSLDAGIVYRIPIADIDARTFFRLFNAWFESLGDWPSDSQLYCAEEAL